MTLQTNLYRLWFVIPARSLIGRKRDFRIILTKKCGQSNHVSSLFVFLTVSDWVKVITFRMLPDAIFSSKILEQLCFISSSDVPWRKGPFISFFHRRKGGNLCFSSNFRRCLTIGKSIHPDFGTNFTHLLVGNHLNFEHKIKTNWSTRTRRENHAVHLHSDVIAR